MRAIEILFTKLHRDSGIIISDVETFDSDKDWLTVRTKLGISYSYRLEHIIGYKIIPSSVSEEL